MVNFKVKRHAHTKGLMKQKSNEHNLLLVIINSFFNKENDQKRRTHQAALSSFVRNFCFVIQVWNMPNANDLNRSVEIRNIVSYNVVYYFDKVNENRIKTKYQRKHKRLTKNLKNVISFTLLTNTGLRTNAIYLCTLRCNRFVWSVQNVCVYTVEIQMIPMESM